MNIEAAKIRLVNAAKSIATRRRVELEELKSMSKGFEREDFIWHYLLQSYSTWGNSAGWDGLMGNVANYNRVCYNVLASLNQAERQQQILDTFAAAGIRYPNVKAKLLAGCFEMVTAMGGVLAAKVRLEHELDKESKLAFLDRFPGIGPKYARNIMMDVYHPDFRESVAIDRRIKSISRLLLIPENWTYEEKEAFYLNAAHAAGLNGWELDRLMYRYTDEFKDALQA